MQYLVPIHRSCEDNNPDQSHHLLSQSPCPTPISNRFTNAWLRLKAIWSSNHHNSAIRATLHTRLRARDHYTLSTLIGGKGGAGPSSLHTTLEGPTEYVNVRWM